MWNFLLKFQAVSEKSVKTLGAAFLLALSFIVFSQQKKIATHLLMTRVSGRQSAEDFNLRVLIPLKSAVFQRNCSSVHSCVYRNKKQTTLNSWSFLRRLANDVNLNPSIMWLSWSYRILQNHIFLVNNQGLLDLPVTYEINRSKAAKLQNGLLICTLEAFSIVQHFASSDSVGCLLYTSEAADE